MRALMCGRPGTPSHHGLLLGVALLLAACGGGNRDFDTSSLPVPWEGEDYAPRRFPPELYSPASTPDRTATGVSLAPFADIVDLRVSTRPLGRPEWSGPGAGPIEWVSIAATTLKTGRRFEEMRQWGAAAGAYRLAVEQNPVYIPAWERYANALNRTGDLDGSLAAFRAAVALDPRYGVGHLNIGQIHEQRGEHDLAEAAYGRAVDAAPHYAMSYVLLGRLLVSRGRLDEALGVFRRADGLIAGSADLAAAQAEVYRRLGDGVMADSLDRRAKGIRAGGGK